MGIITISYFINKITKDIYIHKDRQVETNDTQTYAFK